MVTGLERVASRWPALHRQLLDVDELDTELEWLDHTQAKSLRVAGRLLASCLDRVGEARLQASTIPRGSDSASVYGLAFGDLPRELLARPELQKLKVVLLNGSLDRLLLSRDEHEWLDDERVDLCVGAGEAGVELPCAVSIGALKASSPACGHLKEAIVLVLNQPFQATYLSGVAAQERRQIELNRRLIETDGDVATLFGSSAGQTAVVAAAGPSLVARMPWLRAHRSELTLISVTTALRPLQEAGLRPDFAVAVDSSIKVGVHLDGLEQSALAELPLVYSPGVHPDVLARWMGPRFAAYLHTPIYHALGRELPRGSLFCSGTVTHVAVDLARRMGHQRICLAGVDFSFPGERTHALGVTQGEARQSASSLSVTSGSGATVSSSPALVGYLRDLERYLRSHPEVDFINLGTEGALIEGARFLEPDGVAR